MPRASSRRCTCPREALKAWASRRGRGVRRSGIPVNCRAPDQRPLVFAEIELQTTMVRSDMPPLPLLVFVVGAGSLGAEIAAVRLLAPYFGASTIVWANTIGVVLVALSAGYWLGGRFADRHPHLRGLCLLMLIAAVLMAGIPVGARPL